MKQLLFLIVVSGTLVAQSPSKHVSGEIKGTVIDQDGSPVSFATVYAVPQGLTLDGVTPHSVKADSNGAFDLHGGLEFRSYKLYSRKDSDGYLNPLDAFYADGEYRPVEVALSREQPSATVIVKLGKQAAVISGKIMDAKSGMPLKAYLGVLDEEGNGHSVVVEGDYTVVVPSGRNVTLMVTVLGTRRSLVPVSHFRLEPGQRVFMDIPISAAEK
jgi:hypothetical protein